MKIQLVKYIHTHMEGQFLEALILVSYSFSGQVEHVSGSSQKRSSWWRTITNKQKVRPQVLGAGSNLQNICQLADFESAQLGEIALVSHILTSVKCFSEIWSTHTQGEEQTSCSWNCNKSLPHDTPVQLYTCVLYSSSKRSSLVFKTLTHTQGGRAGPLVLGARSDMWRKEGPNTMAWVATAGNCICIVLHSSSWVQSYLYCIVLYRSTWAQSPDLSEMKSVSGTNGGGALPPLGTFSALNELGLLFKCVCFACVFLIFIH